MREAEGQVGGSQQVSVSGLLIPLHAAGLQPWSIWPMRHGTSNLMEKAAENQ